MFGPPSSFSFAREGESEAGVGGGEDGFDFGGKAEGKNDQFGFADKVGRE